MQKTSPSVQKYKRNPIVMGVHSVILVACLIRIAFSAKKHTRYKWILFKIIWCFPLLIGVLVISSLIWIVEAHEFD